MTRLYRPEILWTVLAAVSMEARAATVVLKEVSDGDQGRAARVSGQGLKEGRASKTGRPGADDHDVILHGFAFHSRLPIGCDVFSALYARARRAGQFKLVVRSPSSC